MKLFGSLQDLVAHEVIGRSFVMDILRVVNGLEDVIHHAFVLEHQICSRLVGL